MFLLLTKIRLMQTNANSLKYFQPTSVPCTTKNRKTKIIIHLQTLRLRQQIRKTADFLRSQSQSDSSSHLPTCPQCRPPCHSPHQHRSVPGSLHVAEPLFVDSSFDLDGNLLPLLLLLLSLLLNLLFPVSSPVLDIQYCNNSLNN